MPPRASPKQPGNRDTHASNLARSARALARRRRFAQPFRVSVVEVSPKAIEEAVRHLQNGSLVAFPTETVYGLGGDALNPVAVARIFEVKERPRFDPLICHTVDQEAAWSLADAVPEAAQALAKAFWPGPLTLVLPKRDYVPDLVTAGQPTVALRVPVHPVARALLAAFRGPIAAPSANRFGCLSPTRAEHVETQLRNGTALVLDGGPCPIGIESSIVSVRPGARPRLLRAGGLGLEALESVAGPLEVPEPSAYPGASPGRFAKHYAPQTPLIIAGDARPPGALRIGRLAFRNPPVSDDYVLAEVLSPEGSLEEAARRLFAVLRRMDSASLDLIEAEPVPESGLGRAIMDRLRRASAARLPSPPTDDLLPS